MRGKRGRGELDERQEVDEAYWAQAAADQAANRDQEDGDTSKRTAHAPTAPIDANLC